MAEWKRIPFQQAYFFYNLIHIKLHLYRKQDWGDLAERQAHWVGWQYQPEEAFCREAPIPPFVVINHLKLALQYVLYTSIKALQVYSLKVLLLLLAIRCRDYLVFKTLSRMRA